MTARRLLASAAPARFPYFEHRTVAQIDAERRLAQPHHARLDTLAAALPDWALVASVLAIIAIFFAFAAELYRVLHQARENTAQRGGKGFGFLHNTDTL
jgi:hypothetical protein